VAPPGFPNEFHDFGDVERSTGVGKFSLVMGNNPRFSAGFVQLSADFP